jgi:hypothetical protein
MNSKQYPSFAEKMRVFLPNRAKYPPEQLIQYVGQWVAFNAEGTEIVAHGPDIRSMALQMTERGIDPQEVVSEYVDDGSSYIGGAEFQ